MSKIIKLTSENVKRLQAVEITPKGNVVVIGGKNGAGKSSVLDSIQYALGGDTSDRMPVRRGEEKAKVVVDLGEIVVKRTFTAGGGTALVVTNADGVRQSSPQGILDKLVGKLTFDPLDFARQKPEKQAETLRALVGLDFTKHDAEHDRLYGERTAVNRRVKELQAQLASLPKHEGVPEEETSTATVLAAQAEATATNSNNASQRRNAAADVAVAENIEREVKRLESELEAAKKRLEEAKPKVISARKRVEESSAEVAKLQDVPVSGFTEKLQTLESVNSKVRANKNRAEVVKQFKAKSDAADELTRKLEAMDSDKKRKTTAAKYPVPALLFDTAGGVTLDGIPFQQCSSAEQLRVSVAIGLALNPKLKVLLIRDGSLLDDASMAILLDMAKEADAQVWLERVGTDASTSVVIEDGTVAAQPEAKQPELV